MPGRYSVLQQFTMLHLSLCTEQGKIDIPHDRKQSLEGLSVSAKRQLLIIERPGGPTKDPGEYVMKLKHVIDAGKDYKVLASDSIRQLQRTPALPLHCLPPMLEIGSHAFLGTCALISTACSCYQLSHSLDISDEASAIPFIQRWWEQKALAMQLYPFPIACTHNAHKMEYDSETNYSAYPCFLC